MWTVSLLTQQVHRFEVFNGAGNRRHWTLDGNARIVAETLVPGAVVSEMARRQRPRPQQVFTWRSEAHRRAMSMEAAAASFVPAVIDPPASEGRPTQSRGRSAGWPGRPRQSNWKSMV